MENKTEGQKRRQKGLVTRSFGKILYFRKSRTHYLEELQKNSWLFDNRLKLNE
jgi:hypothetical protein